MWTLADIQGKYPVGATTFAIPVGNGKDGHIIGKAKLKPNASNGGAAHAPALVLKEVTLTAYYPADTSRTSQGRQPTKGLHWLGSPTKEALRGYTRFGELPFLATYLLLGGVISRVKIPVYPNIRLLNPFKASNGGSKAWPLVVFSHGLGGTRTNYSHYCTQLASQGNVVLAIEHHDGSGPFILPETPVPGRKTPFKPEYRFYLKPEDAYWDDPAIADADKFALRTEQLLFRRIEIYLACSRFKELVQRSGSTMTNELDSIHTVDGPWNFDLDKRRDDLAFWRSWMADESSLPKIQCAEDVHLTGHSFGGATVLSILSRPPPSLPDSVESSPLLVTRAIVLDPWLEPLPTPGPTPWQVETSLSQSPRPIPKLLLLNSEGFTLWEDHFVQLQKLVDVWKQAYANKTSDQPAEQNVTIKLISLIRAKHMSFSDIGILLPKGLNPCANVTESQTFLNVITASCAAFLESDEAFLRYLKGLRTREGEIVPVDIAKKDKPTKWDKKFVGDAGDVIVHV